MKKIVSLIVVVLLIGQMSSIVFAHGERHGQHGTDAVHGLCSVMECSKTEVHRHSGTYYYGHSMSDGHDYHSYCNVEDCTLAGVHQHDDTYYFEHTLEDGHDYHVACTVKGCTELTNHTHDAGLHHNNGNGHHNATHN